MRRELCLRFGESLGRFEKSSNVLRQDPTNAGSALHDMRVSLRTLRAGIRVMSQIDKRPRTRRLAAKLRRLSKSTNMARDEEVLHTTLRGAPFAQWGSKLSKRRRRANMLLAKRIEHFHPERLSIAIQKDLIDLIKSTRKSAISRAVLKMARRDTRKLARDMKDVPQHLNDSRFLHLLRIRAKKIRYTIILFGLILPKKIRRFLETAKQIQDSLGAVHDLDRAIEIVASSRDSSRAQALKLLFRKRERALGQAISTFEE